MLTQKDFYEQFVQALYKYYCVPDKYLLWNSNLNRIFKNHLAHSPHVLCSLLKLNIVKIYIF